jgi:hypothetical protein
MTLSSWCWLSLVKVPPPTAKVSSLVVRVPSSTVRVSSSAVRVLLNNSVDAIGFHCEMC